MLPLTLTGVTLRRGGKTLLGPVDLTLAQGGPVMVIGPNGAGKTKLLRSMHGIERVTGTVAWAVPPEEARRHQAYVFQTPILLRRSVAGNLRYPLALAGVPAKEAGLRVADWAARVGLADKLTLPAARLSGGERQKLAIARALVTGPQVLFLDEPTANLDGHATHEIEDILTRTAAAGTQIIMATHDMGQARRLADRVIFLVGGRMMDEGPADILTHPTTPRLAAFLNGDIVR